ncbi:MAG: FkbM family methyltransferase [Patescibacteria group bacterium]|nr:FkbM family methyltransferase [Patescibacteria group bacterium]
MTFEYDTLGFNTILEIFGGDPYRDFLKTINLKNKQVVDIGAAFGDTAIYFLLEGAKRVYAFEALQSYFRLAKENLRINGFSNFCDLSLSVVGGTPGSIVIDPNFGDMFGTGLESFITGEKVPMITLAQIVEQFNIKDGFLKLDVEGYEYEILLNTSAEILQCFSDMIIEYHYGFERLKNHLVAVGFSVSHTRPHKSAGKDAKDMLVGYVLAKRK